MAGKEKLTDAQKLVKAGSKKVTTIIRAIRHLRSLSRYKPTVAQRDKAFNAIKTELESAHAAWTNPGTGAGTDFSL